MRHGLEGSGWPDGVKHVPRSRIAARIRDGQIIARRLNGAPISWKVVLYSHIGHDSLDSLGVSRSIQIGRETRKHVWELKAKIEYRKSLGLYCREKQLI
jgi:hypothetical protein